MADVKQTAVATANAGDAKSNNFVVNAIIVIICIVVAQLVYRFVLGSPSNFMDANKDVSKNALGTMFQGGMIVPFLIAAAFTLITFSIERFITIFKARGKMGNGEFIKKIQYHLANKNYDAAMAECDKQKGSVGNVMKSGLKKYKEMASNTDLNMDQKLAVIQKEIEESTALEMPMLEKNLVFISTIASVATLLGLLGTVLGMIKSFSAMAQAGAPDANKLASGISEALINTALGIGTSFFAIILYNFFTTILDNVTYGIDESGFTLAQSFKANFK